MLLQICILLILITIIIVSFLVFHHKLKRCAQTLFEQKNHYEGWLHNQKNEFEALLYSQKSEYERKLGVQLTAAENYRKQIEKNLHEQIPDGERILINIFKGLFEAQYFKDFIVYNQLEFNWDGNINRIDFFVVSPKGLFVVESKCWKGVTYFYSKGHPDIFTATEFKSFGVGSSLEIRVFNVKEHEEEKRKLLISAYKNPVAQVRKYSGALKSILPIDDGMGIKNVVVMNKLDKFAMFYNDKPLENQRLDELTRIITDKNIKNYFDIFPDIHYDTQKIVKYIEENLGYRLKIHIDNYTQAPIDLI